MNETMCQRVLRRRPIHQQLHRRNLDIKDVKVSNATRRVPIIVFPL